MADRPSRFRDGLAVLVLGSSALLVTAVFALIVGDILRFGLGRITWEFLISAPKDFGRGGGIGPMFVSTALILAVTMVVALPIGLGSAILLAEYTPTNSWFGRGVRCSLDVLAGVPSIVFGLFGNAFFCKILGMGFSILSGGLTLACMVLPILIRCTEEGFRSVPNDYRLGAAALGISRTSVLFRILAPTALPGLVVGLVLGVGRALAETAALIFTSGYVDRLPESLFDSGRSLSIHIYDLSMNIPGGSENAYGTALVLIVALAIINGLTAWLCERWLRWQVRPI